MKIFADKITPGPWVVNTNIDNKQSSFVKITSSNGTHVVWVGPKSIVDIESIEDAEEMANAYMIAAAPEMRDFIADLLFELEKQINVLPQRVIDVLNRGEGILKKAHNL